METTFCSGPLYGMNGFLVEFNVMVSGSLQLPIASSNPEINMLITTITTARQAATKVKSFADFRSCTTSISYQMASARRMNNKNVWAREKKTKEWKIRNRNRNKILSNNYRK
jgi:precorrin-6B methylase 2